MTMKPCVITTLLALSCALAGCSAKYYRKSADRESYGVIAEKTPRVPNMDPRFTIEQTNALSLEGLRAVTEAEESLGTDGQSEIGAGIISLEKALDIAVNHSRIYQNAKENVYLQALALTLARHEFEPIFFARGHPDYQVTTEEVRVGIDPLTGLPNVISEDANLVEQHRITGQGSVGANWLLKTGGQLSAAFATDFLRYLTGDPRTVTASQLSATLLQPLWRGAGYKVAIENLTQSERNVLYALRDFTQFRKRFSVQIATAYYQVLQARDTVRNNWRGLQNFRLNVERERALAEEGRKTQASLGLLKQSELSTETQWINAIRSYRQSLDNFKLQLGLTTDANVVLDDQELDRLKILHPDMSDEDAVKIALVTRLDLYNVREQHEDTARRIELAINGLKPQVDLVASASLSSKPETSGFPVPDISRYRWNAGFSFDLPLERKLERNVYRQALIAHEQSARQLEQAEDEIKLQVRADWRNLDQAKRSYEISEIGVELSARRVEEQQLRQELGLGTARDLVDAQNDLIASKNQRTQALVSHTNARLQFWNDMGILYIKENGQWKEINDTKKF